MNSYDDNNDDILWLKPNTTQNQLPIQHKDEEDTNICKLIVHNPNQFVGLF